MSEQKGTMRTMNIPTTPSVSGAIPTAGNSTVLGAGVPMLGSGVGSPAAGVPPTAGSSASSSSPVVGGTPGAGMMIPSGIGASAPAPGITAPSSPNSPTRFQDVVVQWAILQRLGSVSEVTTMPDEETARRRFEELSELARQQAPAEPHRWPQLLSGRITWTEVR